MTVDVIDKTLSAQGQDHEAQADVERPSLLRKVLRMGRVEENGIRPLAVEERTNTRFFNIFTVWFSINSNILGIFFGMLGPTIYGLSLRDSALVIVFFGLVTTIPPGYLTVWGPKTGMRQMVQARYSFGRYAVSIPVLFNLVTMMGFTVIVLVLGGQCLSAVSDGRLTATVGIVIIAVLSLLVSFAGFKVLHAFETYAYLVALVSILVTVCIGGRDLDEQWEPPQPPRARQVLDFGMVVASYQIPWAPLASDFTTYFDPKVPSWRAFHYAYWGLLLPTVVLMILGAAIGGALPLHADWTLQFHENLVGGVLSAMLANVHGFGKFLVVVLCLTLLGNTCGTFYAITLNLQTLAPGLSRVPRYVFSIVTTAIIVPIASLALGNFLQNLENFIALIGYWSAAFVAVVMTEHLVFRRGRFDSYDPAAWNKASLLPWGAAAMGAFVVAFGCVVPFMNTKLWTGPVGEKTGDIGFEVAFFVAALAYLPLRWLERRVSGR
ncbi:purine-cytosine permease FCY22 [Drechmeria coniospora]|uniref:Purine-cytosine permease FCY22 n=1 Tax=Drechmeria coniospora TaxID=98403 RepID=A0A151GYG0_DRECN|nr:purine-cytosine permease FCY22 [Drechmeria coniospora]KYK62134.1 purine-cytosine permease FCY22 [Drechmeria coniospora]ODA81365.1 hypothetical protein RJ55_04330 [Drechmeria coniospora]